MVLAAYAKINLLLDILGKTEDGYHTVFNIMQSVDLADYVTVELDGTPGTIQLSCSTPSLPCNADNLAYAAAEHFFQKTGIPNPGIRIFVEKHIPVAAGLAGGSADAAAVYVALNRLLHAGLSERQLSTMAVATGADVPFCIQGGTMLGLYTGGVLAALPAASPCWYVLCNPDQQISTKEAYAAFDTAQNVRHLNREGMLQALMTGNTEQQFINMGNLFEQLLEVPDRVEIKSVLRQHGAKAHLMSGSGPSTYGAFTEKADAEACFHALKAAGYQRVFLCRPSAAGVEILPE